MLLLCCYAAMLLYCYTATLLHCYSYCYRYCCCCCFTTTATNAAVATGASASGSCCLHEFGHYDHLLHPLLARPPLATAALVPTCTAPAVTTTATHSSFWCCVDVDDERTCSLFNCLTLLASLMDLMFNWLLHFAYLGPAKLPYIIPRFDGLNPREAKSRSLAGNLRSVSSLAALEKAS